MPRIFVSYRREDSEHITGRIYDRLHAHFGLEAVFMDIDTIPFGVDFREHLDQAVGQCDILLAIIGEQWLDVRHKEGAQQGQRRLDDPADFVRIEIESALSRKIPVIPVLVGKASMPAEQQMPAELKALAFRNAAEVRSGRDFDDHVARLIRGIEHLESLRKPEEKRRGEGERRQRPTERQPGEVVSLPLGGGIEMQFAWCPSTSWYEEHYKRPFLMGSPEGEDGHDADETQHRVTLTKGFWMGVTPVTQAQWQAVMGDNPSNFKGNDRPVDNVSWDFCDDFRKKLSTKVGKQFRLPTEAEWEYACRAGTTTAYYTGDGLDALKRAGWCSYDGNLGSAKETKPVRKFAANPWGLFDMHGNVWEWCADWFGEYPKDDIDDPKYDNIGDARVLRGGSWYIDPLRCRAACRGRIAPAHRYDIFGCRLVFCLD